MRETTCQTFKDATDEKLKPDNDLTADKQFTTKASDEGTDANVTIDEDTPRKSKRSTKDKLLGSFRFLKKKSEMENSTITEAEGAYKLEVETKTEPGTEESPKLEEAEMKAEEPTNETEVEVKPETKVNPESKAEPEIKTETRVVSADKTEVVPGHNLEVVSEHNLESETQTRSEVQFETGTEELLETEVQPEIETKSEVQPETELQSETIKAREDDEKLEPISEEAESKIEPEVLEKTE